MNLIWWNFEISGPDGNTNRKDGRNNKKQNKGEPPAPGGRGGRGGRERERERGGKRIHFPIQVSMRFVRYAAAAAPTAAAGGTGPKRCFPQQKNLVVVFTCAGAVNKEPRGRHQLQQSERVATGDLLLLCLICWWWTCLWWTMNVYRRGLILATFMGCCASLVLLSASLSTDHWVQSNVHRMTSPFESSGRVHFGLFSGKRELNVGYGWRIYAISGIPSLFLDEISNKVLPWLITLAAISSLIEWSLQLVFIEDLIWSIVWDKAHRFSHHLMLTLPFYWTFEMEWMIMNCDIDWLRYYYAIENSRNTFLLIAYLMGKTA